MRVLLVEDDPTTSKSIEMMLTNANFNVYATDLGEEGIDPAKLYDYDLILLDVQMPEIDGLEFLKMLRAYEDKKGTLQDQRIPIIMVTSLKKPIFDAFNRGCDDYFLKSSSPELLIQKIKEKLG